MFKFIPALALLVFSQNLAAQNFNITYKNPDALVVCAADTLSVTVLNNTAAPANGALLELELPAGLEYLPGSVSGATESDISNLEKPVLALPDLLPGAPLTVRVQLSATCDLVSAINSGQLFSAVLRVRAGALTEQVTTTNFQIQTSLLVITQVDNKLISGEKGDTLLRTIHVRNTRLGPVQHLFLQDAHPEGISLHVDGAVTEQDQPTFYSAYFDGSYFTQFGDGDALLEFGETALIEQRIIILDCGIPSFVVRSNIVAEWSCTAVAPPCQGDTTFADVRILPSTYQPRLVFQTEYALPWDHCAELPHEMRMRVINTGTAPATNIVFQLNSEAPGALGMEKTSFKIRRNSGAQSALTPNLTEDILMPNCGVTKSPFVTLFIAEMKSQDTIDIAFDAYYCMGDCQQLLPKISLNYFYNKPCPAGGFEVSDTVRFQARIDDYLNANVLYSIGECLQDGETYPFTYRLKSDRLLSDTGYLWLKFDLPVGMEWSDDCPLELEGQSPALFTSTPMVTEFPVNRVLLAYELPLPDTSLNFKFCLKNTCPDDGSYVPFSQKIPASGQNFVVYNPDCTNCAYKPVTAALLTLTLDADLDCAVAACDSFLLQTVCENPKCDAQSDTGLVCNLDPICLEERREAYRLNYDLPDNDDDRRADAAGAIDLKKVRRDRFLPGDTLRNILTTKILCGGGIGYLLYQIFPEIIYSNYGYAAVFDTFPIGPYQTDAARYGFTDSSLVRLLEAELTIWDESAQQTYTCPLETIFTRDRLYGEIAQVNTKPPQLIDRMATMNYPFYPVFEQLSVTGCVPAGFSLEAGDSVQLRVDLKYDMNYAPYSQQHFPPLVNVEMGYNANRPYNFYNYRQYDTLMHQYSGYRDSLNAATFGIRPCQNSTQVTPFAYDIRIARENLFPFEVRPLSKIVQYDLMLPPLLIDSPPGLTPLTAELLFLQLQENTPLVQNLPLPFSFIPDSMLSVDFAPAYAIVPDEGYGLRTRVVFGPNCLFTSPDSSAQHIALDFPGCMGQPEDTARYTFENKIGYYSNHPRDTVTTAELVLDFPTDAVRADIVLQNKAPVAAPNFWIQLVNPEGGLTGLTVTVLNTGVVISPANGLYQLGTLPALGKRDLRIRGTNATCDPQRLLVLYGWDCQPYLTPGAPSCGAVDTLELLFRPRNPEIELELVDFPVNVPLCDTSDYFILELSNADLGYAYKPFVNLELPAGLQLLPGSCQLAYPAGSAFVPIPDPTPAGTNLLEWNIAALQDSVAANGLPGVNFDPKNALQIRFRVLAGCGAVSNAQLIFGARAEWYCGRPTNVLRKASDPILVEGLTPTLETQVSITAQPSGGPVYCGLGRRISASILVAGNGMAGDSIYVYIPPGFVYSANSYQPGANAPAGPPQVAGNILRLPLPAGLPANTLVQFSFELVPTDPPECTDPVLRIETRQQVTAFCPIINANCAVYVVNGSASFTLPVPAGTVELKSATLTLTADGKANYTVTLHNPNTQPIEIDLVQFFFDANRDGVPAYPDELLYTIGDLNFVIGPGETLSFPVNGLPAPDSLCDLLALLPALANCICPSNVIAVKNAAVEYAAFELCPNQTVPLGVPELAGHSYSWTPPTGLPCTDCPQIVFAPPGPGAYPLSLTDQGPGCAVTHNYLVNMYDAPVLQAADTTVCRGKNVSLQTSPAVSWNWQGPGVSNPAAPVQTLTAGQSAWYYVTATNAEGCALTDSVFVDVLPADTTDLGILRTCEGTPVDIFGTPTAAPGLYSQVLTNASGCDSLVLLRLEIVPHTSEILPRCPPGPAMVFGNPVFEAGAYCETFTSSLGCDSMHCITVTDLPVPELPDPDTIYFAQGSSVQLNGPDGYAVYLWTPPDFLSCTTCQNPVSAPPDTMTYTLYLTTADGCPDTVVYRLIPFPPCDPARIRVPNAITPNGDGMNDVFRAVPHEGSEIISSLTIYNRWGQKVYEASGPNAAWDGTTSGKPAPSDVYVWLLEVLCDGEKKFRKGDVTVLR